MVSSIPYENASAVPFGRDARTHSQEVRQDDAGLARFAAAFKALPESDAASSISAFVAARKGLFSLEHGESAHSPHRPTIAGSGTIIQTRLIGGEPNEETVGSVLDSVETPILVAEISASLANPQPPANGDRTGLAQGEAAGIHHSASKAREVSQLDMSDVGQSSLADGQRQKALEIAELGHGRGNGTQDERQEETAYRGAPGTLIPPADSTSAPSLEKTAIEQVTQSDGSTAIAAPAMDGEGEAAQAPADSDVATQTSPVITLPQHLAALAGSISAMPQPLPVQTKPSGEPFESGDVTGPKKERVVQPMVATTLQNAPAKPAKGDARVVDGERSETTTAAPAGRVAPAEANDGSGVSSGSKSSADPTARPLESAGMREPTRDVSRTGNATEIAGRTTAPVAPNLAAAGQLQVLTDAAESLADDLFEPGDRKDLFGDTDIARFDSVRRSGSELTQFSAAQALPRAATLQMADLAARFPDRPVELTLSPEELGKVRMTLSTSETGVTMVVHAERPETLDLLKRNIDQLAQDLRSLGFTDVGFSFAGQEHKPTGRMPPEHEDDAGARELANTAGEARIAPVRLELGPQTGLDRRL